MNYISLFSSAGVGCYGFKEAGFDCIATNELIPRRLQIQKYNNKCKYETGYICGDITKEETKDLLRDEIARWKKNDHVKRVDVVIATPPCQGMSVANHKKTSTEIIRNSLVVESIKIIKEIRPLVFIFENVPAFMKTICTDVDGVDKPIAEAIKQNLGKDYSYTSRIINFKNYGACSSRMRTLVIGVANDIGDEVSPFELFPSVEKEKTLRDVIGNMRPLPEWGEIDPADILHAFRTYPEHMRSWITELGEGESAFDNEEDEKKPHQIIDGKIVINQNKNGDKYKRQCWDRVGPCVHTRNDQLASQNTIHPKDDRVFSIRELMRLMTVPDSFKWFEESYDYLNGLSIDEKKGYLKRDAINIRQSLGEAVPTAIFRSIAENIKKACSYKGLTNSEIKQLLSDNDFSNTDKLIDFIENNPMGLSHSVMSRIAELSNTKRTESAAFYTNKMLITEMVKHLPEIENDTITILEPSVGVGNFIPLVAKRYEGKKIVFDLVDIDPNSVDIAKALIKKMDLPSGCEINFIIDDFLLHNFNKQYDLVIGNPPFGKVSASDKLLKEYRKNAINKDTSNICSFFLDKAQSLGNYIAFVFPKFLLNTPEFGATREYLRKKSIPAIIDFGEKGFPGVLIETIAVFVNNKKLPGKTCVQSFVKQIEILQKQSYIFSRGLPYWIIYRDAEFDEVYEKMRFGVFDVFRDRQITNTILSDNNDGIRVLKARNISDDGKEIINIPGYDAYITEEKARGLSVYRFLDTNNCYITPNMTYYPRVMRKPDGVLVNGSVAILIPKEILILSDDQLAYYSSDEYRQFYQKARNYQTRSLNIDKCSVYFFGVLKEAFVY